MDRERSSKKHHNALLDAILQSPDDDAPRLVYADWLQQQPSAEQRARGEFIVVQCGLERAATAEEHNAFKARETPLMRSFARDWCARVGLETDARFKPSWVLYRERDWEVDFCRGFIESVRMSASLFLRVALVLFASEPVRTLSLQGRNAPKLFGRLADVAHFRRLDSLTFDGNGLGDQGVSQLARSAHLSGLSRLAIERNDVTDAGLAAATPLLNVPNLKALSLEGNELGSLAMRALAEAPFARQLTELNLASGAADENAVFELARSPAFGALTKLDLSNNLLGPEHARAIARSPYLGSLRWLGYRGNALNSDVRQEFVERFGANISE